MAWWKPWEWFSTHIDVPRAKTAARYRVILDRPLTLAVGADVDMSWEFALTGAAEDEVVIISFLLVEVADSPLLNVNMNGLNYTYDYAPGAQRTVHEAIGPAARAGKNELTMRVERGSCRFSDLIVWYHVWV